MMLEWAIGAIAIPWFVWVTVSIFSQRQEVALLKREVSLTREIYKLLNDRFNQSSVGSS